MKLSLVVPCYNEADNVSLFQEAVIQAFDGCGYDYEIVFVDDGSKDATLHNLKKIFEKQKLFLRLKAQHRELETYQLCEQNARALLAQMVVLSSMGKPGRLNAENRSRLLESGAIIQDTRICEDPTQLDIVTNYHVKQILLLRQQLLDALEKR